MKPRQDTLHRRRQIRLRSTLAVMKHLGAEAIALGLFASQGDISWDLWVAFVAFGVALPASAAVLITCRCLDPVEESSLAGLQLVHACTTQLGLLLLAPPMLPLAIGGLYVTYHISVLGLGRRQAEFAWLGTAAAGAAALYLVHDSLRVPPMATPTLVGFLLYLVVCLRQLTMLGTGYNALLHRLAERGRALIEAQARLESLSREERLVERERHARERHDSLLQGFNGLVLRFQSATNRIPAGSPARRMMEDALERADDVLMDGRDRLGRHRTISSGCAGLRDAVCAAGEELSDDFGVAFHCISSGQPRPLTDRIEGEAYRLVRDVMLMAFQQRGTTEIVVELSYAPQHLRLGVRRRCPVAAAVRRPAGLTEEMLLIECRVRHMGGSMDVSAPDASDDNLTVTVPGQLAYGPPHDEALAESGWGGRCTWS